MSDNLKLSDGASNSSGSYPIYPVTTKGPILGIDFVEFWVSNAKVTSKWYCSNWGFSPIANKLTATRQSHLISQKDVTFLFTANTKEDPEFTSFLQLHGDAIRDVALRVNDLQGVYDRAISNGARSIEAPHEIQEPDNGTIRMAKIAAPFGDVVHTLVDRTKYKSESYLPKFKVSTLGFTNSPSSSSRGCGLTHIDHVTIAYSQGDMKKAVDWYSQCFGFSQFLCNDDDTEDGLTVEGENSGLKTVILTSSLERFSFKFVLVEAFNDVSKETKNQIQEFIECNGNLSGIQHLALHTKDIIVTVDYLRNRGIEFIDVPDSYYESLYKDENVKKSFMKDSYKTLRELGVLLDISFTDETPKLLMQTFTLPIQDRPTLFMEIICRKGSTGFGSKSIKTLFEAVEKLQLDRKVTTPDD